MRRCGASSTPIRRTCASLKLAPFLTIVLLLFASHFTQLQGAGTPGTGFHATLELLLALCLAGLTTAELATTEYSEPFARLDTMLDGNIERR